MEKPQWIVKSTEFITLFVRLIFCGSKSFETSNDVKMSLIKTLNPAD